MHEMGLAEAILATALDIAGDRPVRRVAVSVGERQAVSEESLSFSFELVAAGTAASEAVLEVRPAAGARLLVDEVEVVGGKGAEVLRRDDSEVVAPAHDHAHDVSEGPVHPAWL